MTDLDNINQLINQLNLCTSVPEKNSNAEEINKVLRALKDHVANPDFVNKASLSDQSIQQLSNALIDFCKISINFSTSLPQYPLFMEVLIHLWNNSHSKISLLIEKESSVAQQYYIMVMDALSNNQNFSAYFTATNVRSVLKCYSTIFLLLLKIIVSADTRHMERLKLLEYTAHQSLHEEKYNPVFLYIIVFIDRFFTKPDNDSISERHIDNAFSLIISLSDSKKFLPIIIQLGFPAKLVEWLNVMSNHNKLSTLLEALIVTISNISQCEEGVNALNEACAFTALRISENALADVLNKCQFIASFYPRIYAMLSTVDQLKNMKVFTPTIEFLVERIREANASPVLRSKTGHLYEYVVSLAKLLTNDDVALYVLNNNEVGGLTFFIDLLYKNNTLSNDDLFVKHLIRLALYNILCSFAFHKSVQEKLKENENFIKTISEASNLSNSSVESLIPSSLRNGLMSVKDAADGILVYLDKFKISMSNENKLIHTSTKKIPMISYSHRDAKFSRRVVSALKKYSITVWIDEDGHCLSDDCWEEIAVAIKNASVVLIVVSDNYCTKSDSCRIEATYAVRLQIPIIALYIDDKYQAEPWLDIHLGGFHVKFGRYPFDERILRLVNCINARSTSLEIPTKTQIHSSDFSHHAPISLMANQDNMSDSMGASKIKIEQSGWKSSLRKWSQDEVKSWWCTQKNLSPQLCTFHDGEALCAYARIFLGLYEQNPVTHLQNLQKQLKKRYDVDFYDDEYANMVSSMKWIIKQTETTDLM